MIRLLFATSHEGALLSGESGTAHIKVLKSHQNAIRKMQATGSYVLSSDLNLTGQVSVVEYMPKFTGNYSAVFLGSWGGNLVAIKIIKAVGKPESVKRKLEREVAVWASTIHPNIYPFHGFANDTAFGPFGALISPWCSNGDASQFLAKNGATTILAERISLWKGVVEGVVYLHDHDPPIVHGDLKPGNILIDGNGAARICDFGLARIFFDQAGTGMTTTSEHTGTPRYLAPELVASETSVPPTLASDVYALGCLGLDFIYLQQPYYHCVNNLRGQIFRDIRRGIPPATKPPQQNWGSARLWPVIARCWNSDPDSRLSALTLGHTLKRIVSTLPSRVIQRIIQLFNSSFYDGKRWNRFSEAEFKEHTSCLANLSLVSRACYVWAMPALYRYVGLYLRSSLSSLSSLNFTLQTSLTKALTLNLATDGYGAYTEILVISFIKWDLLSLALSNAIKTLIYSMPRLQLAVLGLGLERAGNWSARVDSISTLEIRNSSISFLLDRRNTMQALSCFQRLCLVFCTERLFSAIRSSKPCFPDLKEVDIDFIDNAAESQFLEDLSTWTMPTLGSLCYYIRGAPSSLLEFLSTHGSLLRHLTLNFMQYQEGIVVSQILPPCPNLVSAVIRGAPPNTLHSLPYHPNLEQLHIELADGIIDAAQPVTDAYMDHFKEVTAFSLFPSLKVLVVR